MQVLVTCPPMLGMLDHFVAGAREHGFELVPAHVVQTLSEEALCELLPQYEGWIIGDDPATRRVLAAGQSGKLRAVVKWGIGVDNVDFVACGELGLPVTNCPNMFGGEVADVAMSYVVALARHTFEIDRGVRQGAWLKPSGVSLCGRTVALVGLGDIGAHFARRALAADMRVIGYDPGVVETPPGVERAQWPARLEEADFLVFTCALNAANRHMLNAQTLALCKHGVRVVNVARGPLVHEEALADALTLGRVHSVALDVFEVEPLPSSSALRMMNNTIFGSHNGSNTADAVIRCSEYALSQMAAFLSTAGAGG